MTISADILQRLAQYDTPTICNVIELFEVRPHTAGYMDARIRCAFSELPPMVGFAATASFRASAPAAGGDVYGSLEEQVDAFQSLPGPAVVVFQDLDDPPVAAVFGEVMCSAYRAFGSAGLVTNGAGRDLAQVRALEYPVFTGGAICAHGYGHLLHLGAPVHVGGLVVQQGDLLHGDANGVTNIPLDIAADVAAAAAEFVAAEGLVLDYLKAGGSKSTVEFAERDGAADAAIEALRCRLSRRR